MTMLIEVKCNLCGEDDFKVLGNVVISPLGGESKLVKCKRCGLVYVNPRHNEEEEKRFYVSEYFESDPIEVWEVERNRIFKHNLKTLERYKKTGRLLDLGCGMGQFLKMAKDNGWDVIGIDISPSAIEYARRTFNIEIIESSLKDANFEEDFFDVVSSWNTIDQLCDPLGELKETYRILKSGGIVSIRVSNVKFHIFFRNIIKFIGKINYIWVDTEKPPVFHNYMFSPKTITAMLKKAGFYNIAILNSRLSIRNAIFEELIFLICQAIYYLTFKRLVITPSLLIFAQKGELC